MHNTYFMNEVAILADRFSYFGKSPLEIPKEILPFSYGAELDSNGKTISAMECKMGFIIK